MATVMDRPRSDRTAYEGWEKQRLDGLAHGPGPASEVTATRTSPTRWSGRSSTEPRMDHLRKHIDEARVAGISQALGGESKGQVLPPHLFRDVDNDHPIARDELVGPVAPISARTRRRGRAEDREFDGIRPFQIGFHARSRARSALRRKARSRHVARQRPARERPFQQPVRRRKEFRDRALRWRVGSRGFYNRPLGDSPTYAGATFLPRAGCKRPVGRRVTAGERGEHEH